MKSSNLPLWDSTYQTLSTLPPSVWCQTFFILLSSGVLAVAITPPSARRYLLDYGARSSSSTTKNGTNTSGFNSLIATLTSWGQVPHSWFLVFYTTSLACSVFWLAQYLGRGRVLHYLAARQAARSDSKASMVFGQVVVLWGMMALQASRRIYEHVTFIKPSKSKMWCVHWLLGMAFYLCMSVSLWIEGSDAILNRGLTTLQVPLKTVAGIVVFLFAWVNQYRCHKYLAGLKKYSLPEKGMFRYLISPHYTCECLLYLAMAVVSAPEGALYNKTLVCGLLFIVTNLGVTAAGTRKWYAEKFGADAVQGKRNMIPFLY